jgi:hypothetical protein
LVVLVVLHPDAELAVAVMVAVPEKLPFHVTVPEELMVPAEEGLMLQP